MRVIHECTKKPRNESYFAGYIPAVLSTVWDDHPRIRIPDAAKSIATISSNNREVYVITQEGNFYVYDLELVRAGNCDTPTTKESIRISEFLTDSVSYL